MNDEQLSRDVQRLLDIVERQAQTIALLLQRIRDVEVLAKRHDRTFKIIHRGIHDTTDPNGPGV